MGRIEKIVVSTVLFLVAVILAISLRGGAAQADGGPLANAPLPEEGSAGARPGESAAGAPSNAKIAATSNAAGLLDMSGQPPAPPIDPKPAQADPAPAPTEPPVVPPIVKVAPPQPLPGLLLLTTDGLQASRIENLMLYTWQAGDSFAALAQRYYGVAAHASRLRSANEGRSEQSLTAGEQIFVPSAEAPSTRAKSAEAETYAGGSVYVVKGGDVLSSISQKVYGTSKKWKKIYEANQDVLSSPNDLKVGTKLRIPAE